MIEALIVVGQEREPVGKFRFAILPRAGEEITIPWPDDPYGVRIFDVEDVAHTAQNVDDQDRLTLPLVVLRTNEIT